MKLFLLLLLPASVVCQDSSLVKWNAKKKGKSPTDISLVITADIKKGYFIHPCEDCSFNDWDDNDLEGRTDIEVLADSNWTVKLVFSKNKYKQKTTFYKEKSPRSREVKKDSVVTMEKYDVTLYRVDCRVYNKMKLFRGIELTPSDTAIIRYIASLTLKDDASDKDHKKREKMIKEAPKTLVNILPPPNDLLLTIRFKTNNGKREATIITVPNTYKTRKVWGWKKTPRRIVNKEEEPPSKTEDKLALPAPQL